MNLNLEEKNTFFKYQFKTFNQSLKTENIKKSVFKF